MKSGGVLGKMRIQRGVETYQNLKLEMFCSRG